MTPANFITPSSAKFVTPSSGKQSIFSKKSVTTTTIKSSTTTSTSTTSKPSEKEEFLNDQADTKDVNIDTGRDTKERTIFNPIPLYHLLGAYLDD